MRVLVVLALIAACVLYASRRAEAYSSKYDDDSFYGLCSQGMGFQDAKRRLRHVYEDASSDEKRAMRAMCKKGRAEWKSIGRHGRRPSTQQCRDAGYAGRCKHRVLRRKYPCRSKDSSSRCCNISNGQCKTKSDFGNASRLADNISKCKGQSRPAGCRYDFLHPHCTKRDGRYRWRCCPKSSGCSDYQICHQMNGGYARDGKCYVRGTYVMPVPSQPL